MISAALSTSTANLALASSAAGPTGPPASSRATMDTASTSPRRSRWATITTEQDSSPSPVSSVSRPRHRP